jgi:hypothetical protein
VVVMNSFLLMREISESIAVRASAEISRVILFICRNLESYTFFGSSVVRANLQSRPLCKPLSKKNSLQQCVRLSRSTLASAVCSAATPAGSSTASCVLALSNPSRAILARRRVGPPHVRAQPPPRRGALREAPDCPAHVHRVIPSRSPSKPPYPSRPIQRTTTSSSLSLHFTAPSPSRLVALCSFPFAGARHPARRPDALGQDHWRRR